MRCALLCPGPSLAAHTDFADYPLILCVNRAILYRPGIWVALDWKSITRIPAEPGILYTSQESKDLLTPARWPRVHEFDVRVTPHRVLTFASALDVAKELGATSVDVYGADWSDQPDWDGVSLVGNNRDRHRWEREAKAWDEAVERLATIPVTRIGAPARKEAAVDGRNLRELESALDFAVQMTRSGNADLARKYRPQRAKLEKLVASHRSKNAIEQRKARE